MSSLARIREIAERVAGSLGLDIFDVELKREGRERVLRVTLDKPGAGATPEESVSVDDGAANA